MYNDKELNELISACDDQKYFWVKLKRMSTRTERSNPISIQQWEEHFENLFDSNINVDNDFPESHELEFSNDITEALFNDEITDDEILRAVKNLKQGKSGGNDSLIPEFYIHSIDLLLPIICNLFNK